MIKKQKNNVSRCRCNKNYTRTIIWVQILICSKLYTFKIYLQLEYIFKFSYIRFLNFYKCFEEFKRIFFISDFFLLIFENNLKISTVIYYLQPIPCKFIFFFKFNCFLLRFSPRGFQLQSKYIFGWFLKDFVQIWCLTILYFIFFSLSLLPSN